MQLSICATAQKTKTGYLRKYLGACRRSAPSTWWRYTPHVNIIIQKVSDRQSGFHYLWKSQASIHDSVCAVADGNLTENCLSARAVSALNIPNALLETPVLAAQLSSDALWCVLVDFIFICLFFWGHIGFLVSQSSAGFVIPLCLSLLISLCLSAYLSLTWLHTYTCTISSSCWIKSWTAACCIICMLMYVHALSCSASLSLQFPVNTSEIELFFSKTFMWLQ